jgi:hypothetical protein
VNGSIAHLLSKLCGHDHLRRGIDRDLSVVAMLEAAFVRTVRHGAALWTSEVALRFVGRHGLVRIRRFRFPTTLFLASALFFLFTLGQLLLCVGWLLRGTFYGFLFEIHTGLADLLLSALTLR